MLKAKIQRHILTEDGSDKFVKILLSRIRSNAASEISQNRYT